MREDDRKGQEEGRGRRERRKGGRESEKELSNDWQQTTEDPENPDNENIQTTALNNYAVYVKEVQDWELKQQSRNYRKESNG